MQQCQAQAAEFQQEYKKKMRAVQDSLDVLSGKWKIAIITSLCCRPTRRFSDMLGDVVGISNRMLSKELKELEVNQLIKRTILDTQPITVQYELTAHGQTLKTIIDNLTEWGVAHHQKVFAT